MDVSKSYGKNALLKKKETWIKPYREILSCSSVKYTNIHIQVNCSEIKC